MTGCFGAVGDADAQDETTPVEPSSTSNVEMFTVGGMFDLNTTHSEESPWGTAYYPHNIYTNGGELLTIHYFEHRDTELAHIQTSCVDGTDDYTPHGAKDIYVWGSHTSCHHRVMLIEGSWTEQLTFSLVYSISEVTVVQPN